MKIINDNTMSKCRILKILPLAFMLLCSISCEKSEFYDSYLYFYGDSQISNWDVESFFPNRIVINKGKDGSKIDDISSSLVQDENGIVIIEIGTNDLKSIASEDELDDYLHKYNDVVSMISGRKILLMEVFPTNDANRNAIIKSFNSRINKFYRDSKSIMVINVFEPLSSDSIIRPDFTRDGIHLNDYGYRIVSDLIKKEL